MSTLITFLVFCQTLGAGIGVAAAIWSEFTYIQAMRDGTVDGAERAHLNVIAHGLRYGMALLLLASFGLVVASYTQHAALQPALSPTYWTFIAFAFVVIGVSWALSRRRLSFPLGSASLFTAWWFLLYLSFGWLPSLSFGAAIMSYIVMTAIFYAVLYYARRLAKP